ncbi:antitoxin family protein [Chamaesiphon sp.]|uniref:antitoxin family protein n=1 Tax=Chamaesiphon sp. TaxID=2814140 RepID=UPI00359370F9
MNRITAIVRNGKIELLEPIDLPEGTQLTIAIEYDLGVESWTQEEWNNLSLQGLNSLWR